MRTSAKSRQYANLLLKIAESKAALEPVYRSIKTFYGTYRKEPVLKAFLASTKVDAVDKIQLLGKVYPDLHPINQAFIAQLGDERDMKLFGMIVNSLETAFYLRSDQVKVHAVSTSNANADACRQQALSDACRQQALADACRQQALADANRHGATCDARR